MSFNPLSQDVSLQQFPELWESSRFTARQDSLGPNQTEPYHVRQLPTESLESMELQRSIHDQHNRGTITGEQAIKVKEQFTESAEEEAHLLHRDVGNINHGTPTWLSSALLRQHNQEDTEVRDEDAAEKWCPVCAAIISQCMCGMRMHASDATTATFPNQSNYTHWLPMQGTMHAPQPRVDTKDSPFGINHLESTRMATELNLSGAVHGRDDQRFLELRHNVSGSRHVAEYDSRNHQSDWDGTIQKSDWDNIRNKALIVAHPLYPDLLMAHAACLRVGTPVDQLPHIEAQLSQAHIVTNKYSVLHPDQLDVGQDEKLALDRFMTQYIRLLHSFKDQLQQHVYSDVTEAMMSCWELEQALHTLTGISPGGGTGATMSDDEEDYDSDYGAYDSCLDPHDSGGFGSLVPTETERTLMERVRQELKYELKQGYRARIVDVREEILRKRRAGKLPEGTTTVLKAWWHAHAKWPYPTEDEKERLIQETGLELKQVNNWFINQRKRNWHSNPLMASTSELKNKRKSAAGE